MPMEEFSRVVGQRKVAHVQTARGSWPSGGMRRKRTDTAGRGLTGQRTGDWWDRGAVVQSTPLVPWCDQCLA